MSTAAKLGTVGNLGTFPSAQSQRDISIRCFCFVLPGHSVFDFEHFSTDHESVGNLFPGSQPFPTFSTLPKGTQP